MITPAGLMPERRNNAPGTSKVVMVPFLGPQEPVREKVFVKERTDDHSRLIDARGVCTVDRARNIKGGEAAAARAKETMRHATGIGVPSDDHSARGDAARRRKCGARRIECDEGTCSQHPR